MDFPLKTFINHPFWGNHHIFGEHHGLSEDARHFRGELRQSVGTSGKNMGLFENEVYPAW
jgi:hypothetical protein